MLNQIHLQPTWLLLIRCTRLESIVKSDSSPTTSVAVKRYWWLESIVNSDSSPTELVLKLFASKLESIVKSDSSPTVFCVTA